MSHERQILARHAQLIAAKIDTGRPVTPEDVHLLAVLWAATEQPDEAAAGATTAADLDLLAAVRGQRGAGDASAQAICDAACRWRDHTRLDQGPPAGGYRRLLARTVDAYRPSWWRRHRSGVSLTSGVLVGAGGGGDLLILGLAGDDWFMWHGIALAVAAVGMAGATAVMISERRERRR